MLQADCLEPFPKTTFSQKKCLFFPFPLLKFEPKWPFKPKYPPGLGRYRHCKGLLPSWKNSMDGGGWWPQSNG